MRVAETPEELVEHVGTYLEDPASIATAAAGSCSSSVSFSTAAPRSVWPGFVVGELADVTGWPAVLNHVRHCRLRLVRH